MGNAMKPSAYVERAFSLGNLAGQKGDHGTPVIARKPLLFRHGFSPTPTRWRRAGRTGCEARRGERQASHPARPALLDYLPTCPTALLLLFHRLFVALVDGQEAVLYGEGEHGHRGAVIRAKAGVVAAAAGAGPCAVSVLRGKELLVEPVAEAVPVIVAELEHGLRAVVDAVEVVGSAAAHLAVFEDVRAGLQGGGRAMIFLPAQLQRQNAGAGAGHGDLGAGQVAVAAAGRVVAFLDELDGRIDGLWRHIATHVLGGAQGHELPAGAANVGIVAIDGV